MAKLTPSLPLFVAFSIAVVSLGTAAARAADPQPAAGFRFEQLDDKSLKLWEGDKPVFVYNFGPISSAASPNTKPRTTYIHPVYGLDGEVITDDFPADHRNHRGVYWAWPHIKVGDDAQVELWGLRGIQIDFARWLAKEAGPKSATLAVENAWMVGDKKVVHETAKFVVHPAAGDSRAIDVEMTWTPTDKPITLWGAEGKSYGGFNFRFAPRTKTVITAPTGRTTDDLVVTKLPWADFAGDFAGAKGLSGAAVFVAPDHRDYPPEWMTRKYGFLAVGWPGVKPQTLPAGESYRARYRLWVHRGNPEAAEIQKAYDQYTAELKHKQ